MDLNGLLMRAVELGSTDIHLKVGQPPVCRIDGDLLPLQDAQPLDDAALAAVLEIIGRRAPEKIEQFHASGDLDIAYEDEVDASVQSLTSIVEPIMMIGVGLMVGVIIISMYMPMFKMLTLVK
jgi:Tfp pilus assembly pilus retraction ATPase PilT